MKTCFFVSFLDECFSVLPMLLNANRLTNKASWIVCNNRASFLVELKLDSTTFHFEYSHRFSWTSKRNCHISRQCKLNWRPLQILELKHDLSGMGCTHNVPASFIRGPFFWVIINSCAILIDGHYFCTSHHLFVVQRWTHKSNPAISTTVQI